VIAADPIDGSGPAEEALRGLSVEYAAAADRRDGEGLAGLFLPDGALVVPDLSGEDRPPIVCSGHEALRRVPDGLRRYDRTLHLIHGLRFTVDGGTASGRVQCVAHHVSVDPDPAAAGDDRTRPVGTDLVWFLRYHDEYRQADGGWRFARRELHLEWIEEHPVSRLGPAGDRDPFP
jgi:hypothetical protein